MEHRHRDPYHLDVATPSSSSLSPRTETSTDANTERGHDHLNLFEVEQHGAVTLASSREPISGRLVPLPSPTNISGIENRVIDPRSKQSENLLGAGAQSINVQVSDRHIQETRPAEADNDSKLLSISLSGLAVATSSNIGADHDVKGNHEEPLSFVSELGQSYKPTDGIHDNHASRQRLETIVSDSEHQSYSMGIDAARHLHTHAAYAPEVIGIRPNEVWTSTRGNFRRRHEDNSTQSPPSANSNAPAPSIRTNFIPVTRETMAQHGVASSPVSFEPLSKHLRPPMATAAAPALLPQSDGYANNDLNAYGPNVTYHASDSTHVLTHNEDHDISNGSELSFHYPYSSSYVTHRAPSHPTPIAPSHATDALNSERHAISGKNVTILLSPSAIARFCSSFLPYRAWLYHLGVSDWI